MLPIIPLASDPAKRKAILHNIIGAKAWRVIPYLKNPPAL
jgi:hypothetical protein